MQKLVDLQIQARKINKNSKLLVEQSPLRGGPLPKKKPPIKSKFIEKTNQKPQLQ